jgi:hypothetical protein
MERVSLQNKYAMIQPFIIENKTKQKKITEAPRITIVYEAIKI